MKAAWVALAAQVLAGACLAATPTHAIEVSHVSVHLLFTPSGEWSEDVAALEGFASWNFEPVVPVGPVGEPFKSYLVKVRLRASGSLFEKGRVGSIAVRSLRTGRVVYRSTLRDLSIPAGGQAVVARLVDGPVCEPIEVTASVGRSRMTKRINFRCGE